MVFANSMDPDQARQNILTRVGLGTDLENRLCLKESWKLDKLICFMEKPLNRSGSI